MAKPTDNWVFVSQPEKTDKTAMSDWQMLKSAAQKATFEVSLDFGNQDVDLDDVELFFLNNVMPMLQKALQREVGAKAQRFNLRRKNGTDKTADAGDDYYGDTLASTGQALKVLAQRKGIIRLRMVNDLINELLVQTAAHIASSDDPSIKQVGQRQLRELKQTIAGLI